MIDKGVAFMDKKIAMLAEFLEAKTIQRRRDLHKYPEAGWTEYRTASLVVQELRALGYEVAIGKEVLHEESRMGVPDADVLAAHAKRAIEEGAAPDLVAQMEGGRTAVVGTLRFSRPGPLVALRFDMDCNEVAETAALEHRPCQNGFSSIHPGLMHACGHDAHTSVGLGVAEILASLQEELAGTVKLIFQPAEEGTRGAKAIVDKGVVDDVQYMLGAHTGEAPAGSIACHVGHFLATSKFDAVFTGVPAHAGGAPECGKNAMMAAATAALNIQGISRHSQGASRVNVGVLTAGSGRNVIPGQALLKVETRGETSEIDDFVRTAAYRILQGAAQMYDIDIAITKAGGAASATNSPALSDRLERLGRRLGIFDNVVPAHALNGSEDFSYYMQRVQQHGGQAAFVIYGAAAAAPYHNSAFDIDEACLRKAMQFMASAAAELLREQEET